MITFDKSANRYRIPNGQFISRATVRREINKAVDKTSKMMRQVGKDFNAGKINLPEFQIQMADLVKGINILTASIGRGGKNMMRPNDWGTVGAKVREQYKYLNKFARDIELGKVSPVQIENRAGLYAKQSRAGYFRAEMDVAIDAGLTEARRIQNSKEGCPGCDHYASVGWIPIEEMPNIGELECKGFCLCVLEYR